MKNQLMPFLCFFLLVACSSNRRISSNNNYISSNQSTCYKKTSNQFGDIFYDSDFDKSKKKYDAQSDSVKKYLLFSRSGLRAYFELSDETKKMIMDRGGMKSILENILTTQNYLQITDRSKVRYDLILQTTGVVLSVGVEFYQADSNVSFQLNNQELKRLFEFGRQLKFNYKGYFDDEHILSMSYVFPLR